MLRSQRVANVIFGDLVEVDAGQLDLGWRGRGGLRGGVTMLPLHCLSFLDRLCSDRGQPDPRRMQPVIEWEACAVHGKGSALSISSSVMWSGWTCSAICYCERLPHPTACHAGSFPPRQWGGAGHPAVAAAE